MRNFTDFKSLPDFNNHKLVVEVSRPDVNLHGFVAIHNDTLGPAVGGTRMYPYETHKEAITDVLRLSNAMTYKCALAGVKFGGGKGVIIADPKKKKTEALLIAYAEEINKLKGQFYTGEDVGLQEEDVALMLKTSKYFIGRSGQAGDPSPYAALSTFVAMKAACHFVYGMPSLQGKRVAIKGVGKVGSELVRLLISAGVNVVISDIDQEAVNRVINQHPQVTRVENEAILSQQCDIFSPCALGSEFSLDTIKDLQTKIICGGANNQLQNSGVGEELFKHGIVFVPDYLANAGGLIDVVDELHPLGYSKERVRSSVESIEETTFNILQRSALIGIPTNIVSDTMAEEVLKNATTNAVWKENAQPAPQFTQ
ncbi:MAG: Glu/Leu/Phe/Val dehydrogenase dimerization domain-containing protein [Patescibacteria group bacterium]